MDIVVVSDTHGYTGFIEKLVKKHPNAYMYLHAGDSCLREEELYPFETVKGNCDYYINNRKVDQNLLFYFNSWCSNILCI